MAKEVNGSQTYPICGICMDIFQVTYSPLSASSSANSSARIPFGLRLPCPQSHPYCLDCLSTYIKTRLDPNGDGSGNANTVVFPIPCPECNLIEWGDGISDAVAGRILAEELMTVWVCVVHLRIRNRAAHDISQHHQRLLDSLPKYYCPNRKCSALVQVHDDPDEPQASCPSCELLICVPCQTLWHESE